MKIKRAIDLARELGIPARTVTNWCKRDPELAFKKNYVWWIRLDRIAGRPGITLVDAYMLGSSQWIQATRLARLAGISRKTMNNWCRSRPRFAKRIGTDWYVDLDQWGADPDRIEQLLGNPSQTDNQEGVTRVAPMAGEPAVTRCT